MRRVKTRPTIYPPYAGCLSPNNAPSRASSIQFSQRISKRSHEANNDKARIAAGLVRYGIGLISSAPLIGLFASLRHLEHLFNQQP